MLKHSHAKVHVWSHGNLYKPAIEADMHSVHTFTLVFNVLYFEVISSYLQTV